MLNIALNKILDKLPAGELEQDLADFLEPMSDLLPDKRLRAVLRQMVRSILATETPVITAMARSVSPLEADCWAAAKRMYRFLKNERFNHHQVYKGLYRISQAMVAREQPEYLVVALDPVNFEKPYTQELEGVSTVYKSSPPHLSGGKRLTRGYPAITATVVNTRVPGTTYANWFSYQTADFLGQSREMQRALRTTRWIFPEDRLRWVMDSGGDDQKIFARLDQPNTEFVITAAQMARLVEVYNPHLDGWESKHLQDLVDGVSWRMTYQALFRHAGQTRPAEVQMGWFSVRLPNTNQPLWVLVTHDKQEDLTLTLLTNVPLLSQADVIQVYRDWRLRSRIEHGYRFDQEQGLDVEDLRVQTLERMRRLFAIVLAAAQFVFHVINHWPPKVVLWLRKLGGKLGRKSDRDGPYIVLRGISFVLITVTTLSFVALSPFPHHLFRGG